MNLPKNFVLFSTYALARALSFLSRGETESLARMLGRRRDDPLMTRIAYFATCFETEYNGISNRILENGESWLIDRTGSLGFSVVIDVGANVGKWTDLVLKHHPVAKVHCFEIVPATFATLSRNLAEQLDRVALNNTGLAESEGSVEVYVSPSNSAISSLYSFNRDSADVVRCEVMTGAAYAETHELNDIDFLKVDVEGAESSVLKGFESLIKAQKIRLIEFEYNRGALESRFLLQDFYGFLESHGYIVGKLYPEGVEFRRYGWEMEDFMGPNYVACLPDDKALIEVISLASSDTTYINDAASAASLTKSGSKT